MNILPLSFDRPELNLAFEDWFFERFQEDTLRIWRNSPSVVVGKHQNALAECNLHYCLQNTIPVIRRISGGGTVYHDLGNLNFSFFRFADRERLIDYDTNLEIITGALKRMGYPVVVNERHDLFIGRNKVSGNAQHIRRGRALHHGTILYDANLEALRTSIKRPAGTFTDKSVKSVRSQIANLRDHCDIGPAEEFEQRLLEALLLDGHRLNNTTAFDPDLLQPLVLSKYLEPHWNFGYSPTYRYENASSQLHVVLDVERGGKITHALAYRAHQLDTELSGALLGKQHFYDDMQRFFDTTSYSAEVKCEWMKVLF